MLPNFMIEDGLDSRRLGTFSVRPDDGQTMSHLT